VGPPGKGKEGREGRGEKGWKEQRRGREGKGERGGERTKKGKGGERVSEFQNPELASPTYIFLHSS